MRAVRSRMRVARSIGVLAAAVLAVAACGSSDDGGGASATTAAATTAAAPTTGAPETTAGGPATTGAADAPTTAAASDPYAPKPLAKRAQVSIAYAAPLEYAAPIFLAQEFGEFEKENLDVKIEQTLDSLTLMSTGKLDASWGAPDAGMINAIASGIDVKWVAGNYVPDPASKSGLWMRAAVVGNPPDIAKMAGTTTTNSQVGGVVTYFIDRLLQGSGVTIKQLNFKKLSPGDTLAALQNGAIDGAWLLDPLYKQVENDPNMVFVGGPPLGEVGGGMIFSQRLLDPANKDVAVAFLRAIRRTMATHLAPGYKDDPEMVALLAKYGGIPEDQVKASSELDFDLTIADGLGTRMQATWDELGLLDKGPLPEDKVVDRSFVEAVESSSS